MSGLGLVLKNISSMADDTLKLVELSAKNTAAVVGDDIAAGSVNFSELKNSRELPVILSVMKGAFFNKIIIIPFILVLSRFFPEVIHYILFFASLYLMYEGTESFIEIFTGSEKESHTDSKKNGKSENEKIKESVKLDFILSFEIVLITLAFVQNLPFLQKAFIVTTVSFLMVFVIYGSVLFLVKIDDFGYLLYKTGIGKDKKFLVAAGKKIIKFTAVLLRFLPYVGLYAVLFVGGDIFQESLKEITGKEMEIDLKFLFYPMLSVAVGFILLQFVHGIRKIVKGKING